MWGAAEDIPVDRGYDAVLRKGCGVIMLPESTVRVVAFMGLIEGVVKGGHNEHDPAHECCDLVH